jgi:glutamate dehydrogenase/leucine dehydrogenase
MRLPDMSRRIAMAFQHHHMHGPAHGGCRLHHPKRQAAPARNHAKGFGHDDA